MGQKCEGDCGLWVLNEILKKTYPEILKKIVGAVLEIPGDFMKNPQTTIALTFLTHIISDIDGV